MVSDVVKLCAEVLFTANVRFVFYLEERSYVYLVIDHLYLGSFLTLIISYYDLYVPNNLTNT